jgi:YrbI family 3-deoxy-D-manno-octulosonate 8-phosphate phosphatase
MIPKLILSDIDGVLTDGGMYYDETGNEWKKFNVADGMGVLLCRALDIQIALITGENTNIVTRRASKLKIEHVIQGCTNKLEDATTLCNKLNITLKEVAYIGDDLIDMPLLEKVGFSGAPANAPGYLKDKVDYITHKAGGDGAFREFVEEILRRGHKLEPAIEKILTTRYGKKEK